MAKRALFLDRADAGEQLAGRLMKYAGEDPLVLGIPNGGVPVAERIARGLGASLSVWIVRKLAAPGKLVLSLGAVSEGGEVHLDRSLLRLLGIPTDALAEQLRKSRAEVAERAERFRSGDPPPNIRDRTVIVVDDGIVLGATLHVAVHALRKLRPRRLILATPIAVTESLESLRKEVDAVVCLRSDPTLCTVSQGYRDFAEVPDSEVRRLLSAAMAPPTEQPAPVSMH